MKRFPWIEVGLFVVASIGVVAVLQGSSSWTVLDDGLVLNDALWPPDSETNREMRRLGRELSGSGLIFHILLEVFGPNPVPFVFLAVFFVSGTSAVAYWSLRYLGTRTEVACAAALLTLVPSSAPENYLTIFKLETRTALVSALVIASIPVLSKLSARGNIFQISLGCLIVFALALIGVWISKEIVFALPLVLLVAALAIRSGSGPASCSHALLLAAMASGAAVVTALIWRAQLGVSAPTQGGYTEVVMDWGFKRSAISDRAITYLFRTPDLYALLIAYAAALSLVFWKLRRGQWGRAETFGVAAFLISVAYVSVYIIAVSYKQIYYMYPAAALAAMGLGAIWGRTKRTEPDALSPSYLALRVVILVFTAYAFLVGLHLHAVRREALQEVQTADAAALAAIAGNHPELLYLSFDPNSEMISNVGVILNKIHGTSTVVRSLQALDVDMRIDVASVCGAIVGELTTAPSNILLGARGLHYGRVGFDEGLLHSRKLELRVLHSEHRERVIRMIGAYAPDYRTLVSPKKVKWKYGWRVSRIECPAVS